MEEAPRWEDPRPELVQLLSEPGVFMASGFAVEEVIALDGLAGSKVIRTTSDATEVADAPAKAPDVLVYDLDAMGYNKAFEHVMFKARRMKKRVVVVSLGRSRGAITSCSDAMLFHPRTCPLVTGDPCRILCLRTDTYPGQWYTL